MLALTVLAVFLAICLAVYALVGQAEEKATIRESLRQLGGYEIDNQRDRELLDPLRQRAILPVVTALTGLGRRLRPVSASSRRSTAPWPLCLAPCPTSSPGCWARCGPAPAAPRPCEPWTIASTCPRCGPSCWPSCRQTRSVCPLAVSCGPRPTRCA